MYAVTRQHYPNNEYIVEIAIGGLDYTNPNTLVPNYNGEMEEYKDPRKAVRIAIAICKAWHADGCKKAKIAIGNTGGYIMPLEAMSFGKAKKWAEKEYQFLPKCPVCGKITEEPGMPCSWLCELS